MGIDSFSDSTDLRQFVDEVETRVPADARLYLDSGDLLFFYYYITRDFRKYPLQRWLEHEVPGPAPYYIARPERIEKLGIGGEPILEKRHEGRVEVVLFRPSTR